MRVVDLVAGGIAEVLDPLGVEDALDVDDAVLLEDLDLLFGQLVGLWRGLAGNDAVGHCEAGILQTKVVLPKGGLLEDLFPLGRGHVGGRRRCLLLLLCRRTCRIDRRGNVGLQRRLWRSSSILAGGRQMVRRKRRGRKRLRRSDEQDNCCGCRYLHHYVQEILNLYARALAFLNTFLLLWGGGAAAAFASIGAPEFNLGC